MEQKLTKEFESLKAADVFSLLETSEKGLSDSEAQNRANTIGFNEVAEKKKNVFLEFFSYFWGPIPWLLEFATILAFLIGNTFDAFVFLFIVLINGSITFYNEHDSKKALSLLKRKLTIKTNVLRNNSWKIVESRVLVPGDIINLRLGDVVPADVKIISGELSADQSSLTGESLPSSLHAGSIAFTGSVIKRGEAKCVIINTGMRTYFGKTVELVNIAKPKSKQEQIMFSISKNLIYVGAAAFLFVLAYALFVKTPINIILTFAILFIGGGIPATLPMMFTLAQSKGATELSKKDILVTKLDSIENAASVEIICLDKTGTITQNNLEISSIIPFSGFKDKEVALFAALASSAESKDAINNVIMEYTKKNGIVLSNYKRVSYVPFEPSTKREESVVNYKGKKFRIVKGAPQTILSLCKKTTKAQKINFNTQIESLSLKGFRVIAVAKSNYGQQQNLSLVGLLALSDPLRPDSKETIAAIREAGIKPVMLTGDNISVAREIAKQAGIGEHIVRIAEIKSLPEDKQADAILECDGIAEIYPEDKYWVVKILQSKQHMVGMTGDGVNDAPALKQAELGIAVSNSTDVAKAAASMVLTEPGTKVILEAIKTSRETYQRMLTWTLKKIARSIQFMMILIVGFFWLHDVIVSITGLLLLLVVNDFLTMSLAVDNARSTKNPNSWNVKNITIASVFIGVLLFVIVLALLIVGVDYLKFNMEQIQAFVLIALVYTGQLGIFIVRERGHFWNSKPNWFVSSLIIFSVVMFTVLGGLGIAVALIPWSVLLITLAVCSVFILVMDWPKFWVFRKLGL